MNIVHHELMTGDKRELLEKQVLGTILWFPESVKLVDLTTEDFSWPIGREIYAAILTLSENGDPITETTVYRTLGKHCGAVNELPWVCGQSHETVLYYLRELKREIAREKKKEMAEKLRIRVKSGVDAALAASEMQDSLREIEVRYGEGRQNEQSGLEDATNQLLIRIRERACGKKVTKFGVSWIDRMTKGMAPGEYAILAARPSVGKTALALQILAEIAGSGRKAMLISLEMSNEALASRLLSYVGMADSTIAARSPDQLGDETRNHFLSCSHEVRSAAQNIWTVCRNVTGPAGLRARVQQAKDAGCCLVVCDYLQLIPYPGSQTRVEKVGDLSREWKLALVDAEIPGIMLSQLSRAGEKEKRRPQLSDLRDSGAIEQDADIVWFLHRKSDQPGPFFQTDFIQAKGRNLGTGFLKTIFNGEQQRFAEAT